MLQFYIMKVAFEEYGKGKPVVLLHAFPLSKKMWKSQIDVLVAANCRVILPDFRGFGETELVSEITKMEDLATDIKDLLDDLEIEKAIIGGLSMGGYVTLNMYRLYPEKFAGMILADTSSLADTEEKREGRFKLIEETETKGIAVIVEGMVPKLTSDHTKNEHPEIIDQINHDASQTNPKGAIAALRGMAARHDHTEMLKDISVSTLLIFGAEDKVTNLDGAKILDENIPDSKLEIIEKIGHLANLEDPESFNKILVEFVKTVEV